MWKKLRLLASILRTHFKKLTNVSYVNNQQFTRRTLVTQQLIPHTVSGGCKRRTLFFPHLFKINNKYQGVNNHFGGSISSCVSRKLELNGRLLK